MAPSNFGVLPKAADAYCVVWSYLVPLAIPLLLLLMKADLRRMIAETKGMLVHFLWQRSVPLLAPYSGFLCCPLETRPISSQVYLALRLSVAP